MKITLLSFAMALATAGVALADNIIVLKRTDVYAGTNYSFEFQSGNMDPTYAGTPPLLAPTVQVGTTPGDANLEKGKANLILSGTQNFYYVVDLDTGEVRQIDFWTDGTKFYTTDPSFQYNPATVLSDIVTDRIPSRTVGGVQWVFARHSSDDTANPPYSFYTDDLNYTGLATPLLIPASTATGYPVQPAKTIPGVPRTLTGKWYELYEDAYDFIDGVFDKTRSADVYTTPISILLDTINTPLVNNGPKLPVCS